MLDEERVHVFRQPSATGYEARTIRELGEDLEIEALPQVGRFAVAEVLGP